MVGEEEGKLDVGSVLEGLMKVRRLKAMGRVHSSTRDVTYSSPVTAARHSKLLG